MTFMSLNGSPAQSAGVIRRLRRRAFEVLYARQNVASICVAIIREGSVFKRMRSDCLDSGRGSSALKLEDSIERSLAVFHKG